jgi:hypothetical protein
VSVLRTCPYLDSWVKYIPSYDLWFVNEILMCIDSNNQLCSLLYFQIIKFTFGGFAKFHSIFWQTTSMYLLQFVWPLKKGNYYYSVPILSMYFFWFNDCSIWKLQAHSPHLLFCVGFFALGLAQVDFRNRTNSTSVHHVFKISCNQNVLYSFDVYFVS